MSGVYRACRRRLPTTLSLLGLPDSKAVVTSVDQKDRRKIRAEIRKLAAAAQSLELFSDALSPLHQAYIHMHGEDSEFLRDIAADNAQRWRDNVFNKAFAKG